MKIAVFSDTHGWKAGMIKAIEDYAPDQVIHLGNCDLMPLAPEKDVVQLGPVKAFITHGHLFNVKYGRLDSLVYAAMEQGARIAMFGHTHRAGFEQTGGIFVLNPGTAGKPPRRTWAKLEIGAEGEINCKICDIV